MDRYKKLLWLIFKENTEGCDIYHNNGSIWLILTDEKRWVIELTKEGTLWYNYYFFKDCFRLLSLDVIENQNYITEWVENTIQNGVKNTNPDAPRDGATVDDTIQNGVKNTDWCQIGTSTSIEDAIQNGVKETKHNPFEDGLAMEEAIQNGVKETTPGGYLGSVDMKGKMVHQFESPKQNSEVEDTIQNGVKETKYCELHSLMRADHIIRDGIKETHWRRVDNHPTYLDRIIKN